MVVIQDGFGGRSFQGQRWEKYMDLVLGLVEKEYEEVEVRDGLRRK
jgi:hypothetical protein